MADDLRRAMTNLLRKAEMGGDVDFLMDFRRRFYNFRDPNSSVDDKLHIVFICKSKKYKVISHVLAPDCTGTS